VGEIVSIEESRTDTSLVYVHRGYRAL